MSLSTCLLVMLGGALGTLARYGLSVLLAPAGAVLPWGTILINTAGSLLIGLFGALTAADGRHPAPEPLRLFVMVGVCGGFTTFSAFSLQTFDLLRSGAVVRAGLNVALSVLLCVAAVAAGGLLGSHLAGGGARVAQAPVVEEEA